MIIGDHKQEKVDSLTYLGSINIEEICKVFYMEHCNICITIWTIETKKNNVKKALKCGKKKMEENSWKERITN